MIAALDAAALDAAALDAAALDAAALPTNLPAGVPPLLHVLKQVPDFRSKQGKRYPLEAILALGIAATLCGYNSYGAMAEWGKNDGGELAQALGFANGKTPSVGTLFTVFVHGLLPGRQAGTGNRAQCLERAGA